MATLDDIQPLVKGQSDWQKTVNAILNFAKANEDTVLAHILTPGNGLTLANGVSDGTVIIVDLNNIQLVLVHVDIPTSFTSNQWTDACYVPTDYYKGHNNSPELLDDLSSGSPTHTHILCDTSKGSFPCFVYGKESGGIKDLTYACRLFFVY